jgi:hypothetical protein
VTSVKSATRGTRTLVGLDPIGNVIRDREGQSEGPQTNAAENRVQDGQSAIVPGATNTAVAHGAASHRGGTVLNRPHMVAALRPRRVARVRHRSQARTSWSGPRSRRQNLGSQSDSLSRNQNGSSRSLSRRNTARIAPT